MSQPLKEDHGRTEAAGRGTCPAIQGRPHRRKPAACNVLSTGSPARTGRHQPGGGLTMADIRPYRSTPVFDQDTLPAALRARHDTKAGVWGLIRVIEGELKPTYPHPPSEVVLPPRNPGLILTQQPPYVTPPGPPK